MKPHILAQMTPEDFDQPDLRRCAEAIGVEATVRLLHEFGGSHVYFPHNWRRGFVRAYVARHLGEMDVKEIARELGVTTRAVQRAAWQPAPRPLAPAPGVQQALL